MDIEFKKHLLKRGFEVVEQIGSGLSGKTFKGLQINLNRSVAIKLFDSSLNNNNHDIKKRFLRESQILAELQHSSIPYVLTKGTISSANGDGTPYIIMQYIPGVTLEEYIDKNSPISIDVAINISTQILDALNFVHENKIIHRDIKPSNIMVLPSGHCFLIDFSIGFKTTPQKGMTRATRSGDHLGSLEYMSPEQMKDMKSVDKRTDIYSYSLVLCKLLTKKPDLSSVEQVNLPSTLINILKKAASYDLDNRYSTALEFSRELRQVSSSSLTYIDSPSKALCKNTKCPSGTWSNNGYYKGPYFISESTELFCTSCGGKLLYQCENCGKPIENTRYCGGCGFERYDIPKCEKCGSYLKEVDMDTDTSISGCGKCSSGDLQTNVIPKENDFDDDIPF